ncbi:MAG: hypothetical protein ACYC6B_07085 [Thermoleophilia bacterium]
MAINDTSSLLLDDFDEASYLKSLATKDTQDFCHKWENPIKVFQTFRSKILEEILSSYSRVKEHAIPGAWTVISASNPANQIDNQ